MYADRLTLVGVKFVYLCISFRKKYLLNKYIKSYNTMLFTNPCDQRASVQLDTVSLSIKLEIRLRFQIYGCNS